MTKQEIAKHVFARNPKLEELFITSDGQVFHEEHRAEGHGQRLKDRTVATYSRAEFVAKAVAEVKEKVEGKVKTLQKVQDSKKAAAEKKAKEEAEKKAAAEKSAQEEAAKKAAAENGSDDSDQDTEKAKELEVNGEEVVKPFSFLKENVGPASEQIGKIETLEELEAIAEAEKAGEDRKGVHAAIEARRAELTESNNQKPE